MKKRWRLGTSRRSPDRTSPPSGSGEPASPPSQSASPDRCGGGVTSSAPARALALAREGGGDWRRNRQKRRRNKEKQRACILDQPSVAGSISISLPSSQKGDVPSAPTPGKNAGKRLVSRTVKRNCLSPRRLSLGASRSSSQSLAAKWKNWLAEEEDWFDEEKTSSGLKVDKPKPPSSGYHGKISLDEYEDGQSDKTPSLDSEYEDGQSDKTPSLDLTKTIAQDEEVSCDGGETSSQIMVEKKPKPSSGHHGRIAQEDEEDGYSGATPPSTDLIKLIAQDGDGQRSKEIGVRDIEEHKRERGGARGHARDLLYVDDETISKKISYFRKMLNNDSPERYYGREYEPEELIELYERLALYRIRAYELTVDRKLAALDDVNLKLQYPPSKLYDEGFFKCYEESFEWYFDPDLCKHTHFDDYQRLTLRSNGKYQDWERYHSTLNTYEEDLAYVQYCEVLTNETKWIDDYMGDSTQSWNRLESVVYIQALETAVGFPNVSPFSVSYGFIVMEHICSMEFDHYYKGLDGLYFEIWKQVAKGKMSFREALLEVHSKDMFPSLSIRIKLELEHPEWGQQLKDFYDAHVSSIDKMASDDKAFELITQAVTEMFPRDRYYLDYAKKKLDIAKDIGLIPKGRRREFALKDNGENCKEKVSPEKGKQAMTGCEKGTVALLV